MFGPFRGRVAPDRPENIKAAQEGCLKIDWPWLVDSYSDTTTALSDHNYCAPVHPLTGKLKYNLCTTNVLVKMQVQVTTIVSSILYMRVILRRKRRY